MWALSQDPGKAFRRAPALTLFRSATWYWRCLLRMATTLELPRWNVRMFFPAQRKVSESLYLLFVSTTNLNWPIWKRSFRQGDFHRRGRQLWRLHARSEQTPGAAGRVIAIEPTAQSFAVLRQNIALKPFCECACFSSRANADKRQGVALSRLRSCRQLAGMDPLRRRRRRRGPNRITRQFA